MQNFKCVELGNITLYYSYETIIAFRDRNGLTISENVWSKTTGKHLNEICTNKNIRIPYSEFQQKLNALLRAHNLN